MDIEDIEDKIRALELNKCRVNLEEEGGAKKKPDIYKQVQDLLNKQMTETKKDEYGAFKTDTAKKSQEIRQDVSERVKELVNELASTNDLRFAEFKGNMGTGRKKYSCPHCEKEMIVAGVRKVKPIGEKKKELSTGQKDWHSYVNAVAAIPDYKDMKRKDIMKAASKLKKEGHSIDDIKMIARS